MPAFNSHQLLTDLEGKVREIDLKVEVLKDLSDEVLNFNPAPGSWSAAQVLEHLNSYNRFYLPEIEKAISVSRQNGMIPATEFRPGLFGNYFTNLMLPKAGKKTGKMKAPKNHTPPSQLNVAKVVGEFLQGQHRLLEYLRSAKTADLNRVKVAVSISKLIKLKLGDGFRFVIAHQLRHMAQLEKALSVAKKNIPGKIVA